MTKTETTPAARLAPGAVIDVRGEAVRILGVLTIDSIGAVQLVGRYAVDGSDYAATVADDVPLMVLA